MDERHIAWKEYGQTDFHPFVLAWTLCMALILWRSQRGRAALPILLVACLVPTAQRIVIAGLDFPMVRLLILAGWARIFSRGELRGFKVDSLDLALVSWWFVGTVVHVAREANFGALVYRLGLGYDALGMYFLLRMLLQSARDVHRSLFQMVGVAIVIAAFIAVEGATGRNFFSVFGGVAEYTAIRDGRLRCQGAFTHPIMAGSFGASVVPLCIGIWLAMPRHRVLAGLGIVGGSLIAILSASSGPAIAWAAGLGGWGLWLFRDRMNQIRWAAVGAMVAVQIAMEKPLWHLILRLGNIFGGTGYHRYHLIDAFVRNFREWWLLGTKSTAHWGWGLQDVTNMYVLQGVRGGIVTLGAFLWLIVRAFTSLGEVMARNLAAPTLSKEAAERRNLIAWGMGVSLMTHCLSFVSVTYFGQMQIVLYMLLAYVAALRGVAPRVVTRKRRRRPVEAREPHASDSPAAASG